VVVLLMPATGVFENAIDMAHIHYLHNDSFGNSEKPRIHDMATTRDTFHVEANFRWAVGPLGSCSVLSILLV
jgi:phenylpropionate dioxygenase-like ring-hydroxylating dioxygenase large terminal subunit